MTLKKSNNNSTNSADSAKERADKARKLPIVGIGASAGGLEALSDLFSHMPDDTGIAFVLVVHLDPHHQSLLPELLQRKTALKVHQIEDNMKIEANHLYIIPPNHELAIYQGCLQLLDIHSNTVLHQQIDAFFDSLAREQGDQSVAIILSGTGSDGTAGSRTINSAGGFVIAQDMATAKFEGMPQNAIEFGMVDMVLAPQQIPEKLVALFKKQGRKKLQLELSKNENHKKELNKIFTILRSKTKHDFSMYKINTIIRRIERRMSFHQLNKLEDYSHYLQKNEAEVQLLFKDILIGVTSFFRDQEAFEALKEKYIPLLFQDRDANDPIRVWIPGCSTGEEVYSIAILIYECMEQFNHYYNVQIFGTDIDEVAIEKARTGKYAEFIARDISPKRLKKFFNKEQNSYQIKKIIREMVVFAPQDVIKDPPFTKINLLCCRNLLIYFGAELQKKLLPVFHYSLKDNGLLFIGSSESIGQSSDLFVNLDKKWKIFKRLDSKANARGILNFSSAEPVTSHQLVEKQSANTDSGATTVDTIKLLKTILSQSQLSPRVIIDAQANIIYIHGRVGRYLEPAEGIMTSNIIDMARPGLQAGLASGIRQAIKKLQDIEIKANKVQNQGETLLINLKISLLSDIQTTHKPLLMVLFEEEVDKANKKPLKKTVKQIDHDQLFSLQQELKYTKENLQSTIEELQTANEDMKSSNEELQSTNEELQSTNEELETSKEELQSLNEESSTVNVELQSRIDELMNAKDDIKNLLDATEIASIFLNINLAVRRFTPQSTSLIPLTESDIGRPIQHFASNLVEVDLSAYAGKVLQDLSMQEQQVADKKGNVYRMRIRPYRTYNNVIDGVVITFEDISKIIKVEQELTLLASNVEEKLLIMSKVFMDAADPIILLDLNSIIIDINYEVERSYGWTRNELINQNINLLCSADAQKQMDKCIQACILNQNPIRNIESKHSDKSGKSFSVLLSYSAIFDSHGDITAIALMEKQFKAVS